MRAFASARLVEQIWPTARAPRRRRGLAAQAGAARDLDALDRMDELAAPTLVLTGTADAVVDLRNAELLAERIPDARLERFEGAGHLFFWEEPERFARQSRSSCSG